MYKGNRSRKKNKLDKDIQNEIEKNIIISNISNRSRLENRINKVNYIKNTRFGVIDKIPDDKSYLNEGKLLDIEIKENEKPVVYDLNKHENKEEKNEILEDIDKILMTRDINSEINDYYNKYNEESLEKDIDKDIDEKELNEDSVLTNTNIECIRKDKDLICYGLLNKTELNELNNYLNKDVLTGKKNNFINMSDKGLALYKNKEIIFSEKEDNSLIKELRFNPTIYMEIEGECKVEKINDSIVKKGKNYYDRVIDNLYKLFIPK